MNLRANGNFRVAHATRVQVATSRRNSLSMRNRPALNFAHLEKFAMARTPSPARETRALPNLKQSAARMSI
jgi:hypothetical protein